MQYHLGFDLKRCESVSSTTMDTYRAYTVYTIKTCYWVSVHNREELHSSQHIRVMYYYFYKTSTLLVLLKILT